MVFFYFLPMFIAIAFILARVARGGSLKPRPSGVSMALGFGAIAVLGVLGMVFARMLQ